MGRACGKRAREDGRLSDTADQGWREIELKFDVDAGDVQRLRQSALLRGSDPPAAAQRTTYFDTKGGRLRKAGLTLRIRQIGDRMIQTVKAEAADGALFDRAEWEWDVAGPEPDRDLLTATPAAGVLGKGRLVPLFSAEVTRRSWLIEEADGTVELVHDEGMIATGQARDAVCEIELELKHGSPALLFALARSIDAAVPVRLGIRSKSERGFRLIDGAGDGAVKAEAVRLDAGMDAAAAFATIAWNCIRQFRANEPLLLRSGDPEALHQARVGLRRLRSAVSLFAPVVAGPEAESIRAELRWIAGLLGAARDLDVMLDFAEGADAAERRAQLSRQRNAAFSRAVAALESSRFRTMMIELARWITLGGWRQDAVAAEPIEPVASAILDRFRRKLKRAAGDDLTLLDDDGRHRVRIIAKKLRYGSEFFAGLHTDGRRPQLRKRFLATLVRLQEKLGELNDMATARQFPGELFDAERWNADRVRLIGEAQVHYRALLGAKPYWR